MGQGRGAAELGVSSSGSLQVAVEQSSGGPTGVGGPASEPASLCAETLAEAQCTHKYLPRGPSP